MDPQADDDDAQQGEALRPMSANSGKKLGENLGGKADTQISVSYPNQPKKEEPLQWAPHHLIPGNASLKGSNIAPFLGDDTVISKFKKGTASKIKDKQSVGYDVNSGANGVWLPSPYALSMKGKWPTNPAAKLAYVEAAIDQNGGNSQFHMCHTLYSLKVREVLDLIGDKLELITTSNKCEKANTNAGDKFDAPRGLNARLNALSGKMNRFLTGPVWREPLFTDDTLMAEYRAAKAMKVIPGLNGDVTPLKVGSL
jgi:A nuclease family of the HNH/ENDO VII superfamily with conserved AHH